MEPTPQDWIEEVRWNSEGLAPAIAQESSSRRLLTLAWMNRAALAATVAERRAIYWSRSRACLWRKGEQSGHVQHLVEVRLDCDQDAILLLVRQEGGIACHTGRESCFFSILDNGRWVPVDPVKQDPARIDPDKESE